MVMTLEERFWSKVDKSGNCWLWIGAKSCGYGHISIGGKQVKAHRVSWELHNGQIPEGEGYHGMCVCHACDVRSCIRPDHLFLGSNADNMADKYAKGMHRGGVGSRNRNAKLTEEDIPIIRQWVADGWSQQQCAEIWGINRSAINKIVTGKLWGHV